MPGIGEDTVEGGAPPATGRTARSGAFGGEPLPPVVRKVLQISLAASVVALCLIGIAHLLRLSEAATRPSPPDREPLDRAAPRRPAIPAAAG